jgi:hypothetical protein
VLTAGHVGQVLCRVPAAWRSCAAAPSYMSSGQAWTAVTSSAPARPRSAATLLLPPAEEAAASGAAAAQPASTQASGGHKSRARAHVPTAVTGLTAMRWTAEQRVAQHVGVGDGPVGDRSVAQARTAGGRAASSYNWTRILVGIDQAVMLGQARDMAQVVAAPA